MKLYSKRIIFVLIWMSVFNYILSENPYGIPDKIWNSCKIIYNGNEILDMTTKKWVTLSSDEQIEYANAYQKAYATTKNIPVQKYIKTKIKRKIPQEIETYKDTEGMWWWKEPVLKIKITKDEKNEIVEENLIHVYLIPPAKFFMGSPNDELNRNWDETQHIVIISKPFYISKYEITETQWKIIKDEQKTSFLLERPDDEEYKKFNQEKIKKDPESISFPYKDTPIANINYYDYPKSDISWEESIEFCQKLGGSLPTEAQWEYATRAGMTSKFCYGDNSNQLGEYAYFDNNSNKEKKYIGQKKPNAYGLYDCHGNLWEFCWDWHQNDYPKEIIEPIVAKEDSEQFKVVRGGAYNSPKDLLRSANRDFVKINDKKPEIGFRIVFPVEIK